MLGVMKVHLYQVVAYNNTVPLEETLEEVAQADLEQRLRSLGGQQHEVRIEKILRPNDQGNKSKFWLMDFTRLRFDHGPGRVSRTDPIAGFDLEVDEGFGEETAALYDPEHGYLLVQYNHFGVRSGLINDYFAQFDQGAVREYALHPKMDESSEVRLAQKEILKKVTFKVATASISDSQRKAGVSLERALALSDHLKGQTIEVTISSGRSMRTMLSKSRVMKMVRQLQQLAGTDDDGGAVVSKLEVVGKSTSESVAEAIDLLAPKLETSIDGLVLGLDRRYTFESRSRALLRARAGWATVIAS